MTLPEQITLAGHVSVVTGGTRGIGRLTVERLAALGSAVALCARAADEVADTTAALVDRYGVAVHGAVVDVADAEAVAAFAAEVADRLGPATLVVANAAVLGPVGPLASLDLADWARALGVNVLGAAHTAAAFAPRMARSGGSIVMLAGGGVGGPGVAGRISAYTTSKAAIVMLVETLAGELAEAGVRVHAVAPGAFPTGFTAGILAAGPDVAGADLFGATAANQAAEGPFERYADLLVYLASERSAWLSGRLLSARWETPQALEDARAGIEAGDRFRLRRIDETLYGALPRG